MRPTEGKKPILDITMPTHSIRFDEIFLKELYSQLFNLLNKA